MTYNPSIPLATDLISASQQPIEDNFTQLNTQFSVDHTGFNNGGVNGNGFHKQITLPTPVAAAPAGLVGILHNVTGANFFLNKALPYFANSLGDYPLMPDLKTSGTQRAFVIGNIKVNYGSASCTGSTTTTVTFPAGFTYTSTGDFFVQITPYNIALNLPPLTLVNASASTFTIVNTSSTTITINFFAIGI